MSHIIVNKVPSKKRILFISQEIAPYVSENKMSKLSRELPEAIQKLGSEVRIFMPCFGKINERRYQLHDVIRLSGMNISIGNHNYTVDIKAASIPNIRMQIYFIDNEDFFDRKSISADPKTQKFYKDNDERMIFFSRAVIEIVKKLRWKPDLIHCHGWMSSLIPFYLKNTYKEDPIYANSKIVFSLYNNGFSDLMNKSLPKKILELDKLEKKSLSALEDNSYKSLMKLAIAYSDGVITGSKNVGKELITFASQNNKPLLEGVLEEGFEKIYDAFYKSLLPK